jgi:hypothetical protein
VCALPPVVVALVSILPRPLLVLLPFFPVAILSLISRSPPVLADRLYAAPAARLLNGVW